MNSKRNASRREILQIGALSAAGFLLQSSIPNVKNAASQDGIEPLNRFPRMVQEYFVDTVSAIDQANKEKIFSLKKEVEAQIQKTTDRITKLKSLRDNNLDKEKDHLTFLRDIDSSLSQSQNLGL